MAGGRDLRACEHLCKREDLVELETLGAPVGFGNLGIWGSDLVEGGWGRQEAFRCRGSLLAALWSRLGNFKTPVANRAQSLEVGPGHLYFISARPLPQPR